MLDRPEYPPIADHALLADCHSSALVTRDGTIDWACLLRFDSDSVFGSLLDHERGGHLVLRPRDIQSVSRRYIEHSLVLETTFTTSTGTVALYDGFAMHQGGRNEPRHQLFRILECSDGTVEIEVEVTPRFDYGTLQPWLRQTDRDTFTAVGSDDAMVIACDMALTLDTGRGLLHGTATLEAGERRRLSVLAQQPHLLDPTALDVARIDAHLDETLAWWRGWSAHTTAPAPYAEAVHRSAVVLKGLTCAPTGAIIAAPTTSLPEQIGGERNWDYRYSWVRDATLTLQALASVGHDEVAQGFRDFLMRSAAGSATDLQIMYGPYGARRLPEIELDLAGYRDSRPVRIGNGAAGQRQLDVFGYILDSAHLWQAGHDRIDADEWAFLSQVVDAAADAWREPDQGLWEMRGEPRQFVDSKVMCWVALDRGIRLIEDGAGDGDMDRWQRERDTIRETVMRDGLDPSGSHFVQAFGDDQVDASLLRLPSTGFIAADDPLMVATVAAVQERLATPPDGFLLRYSTAGGHDGLQGEEGTFLLCSFWLVEALAMQGDIDEATALFERLLAVGNDVGLFAEEVDAQTGELLGNFPQAFTHLGIIRSAFCLDRMQTD